MQQCMARLQADSCHRTYADRPVLKWKRRMGRSALGVVIGLFAEAFGFEAFRRQKLPVFTGVIAREMVSYCACDIVIPCEPANKCSELFDFRLPSRAVASRRSSDRSPIQKQYRKTWTGIGGRKFCKRNLALWKHGRIF